MATAPKKKAPKPKTPAKKSGGAVATPLAATGKGVEKTVSARRIENGWIVTEETYDRNKGSILRKESFTKTEPKFQIKT